MHRLWVEAFPFYIMCAQQRKLCKRIPCPCVYDNSFIYTKLNWSRTGQKKLVIKPVRQVNKIPRVKQESVSLKNVTPSLPWWTFQKVSLLINLETLLFCFFLLILILLLPGFVFACGPGYVHMFEKETPHHWRKRNVFRISKKSYKYVKRMLLSCDLLLILTNVLQLFFVHT